MGAHWAAKLRDKWRVPFLISPDSVGRNFSIALPMMLSRVFKNNKNN